MPFGFDLWVLVGTEFRMHRYLDRDHQATPLSLDSILFIADNLFEYRNFFGGVTRGEPWPLKNVENIVLE